jgi:hypothetical protein
LIDEKMAYVRNYYLSQYFMAIELMPPLKPIQRKNLITMKKNTLMA